MTKHLSDFDSAAKFRDAVERIAGRVVDDKRPKDRIARVVSINAEQYTAEVQQAGDAGTLKVRFTPSLMPRTEGVIVRVAGKPGDYYITAVLNASAANADYEPFKEAYENGELIGPPGPDGETQYTWLKYADSPTTGMSDDPTGKAYIGLAYNKTTPVESTEYADYSWSLIQGEKGDTGDTGATGDPGVPGPPGEDGTPRYTWIKYGTSAAGANLSDSPTGKTYIGLAYNKLTDVESTNPADYTWALIQGPKGAKGDTGATGATGQPGADGESLYTWFKYADNATGTSGFSDDPAGRTYIGVAYNKPTQVESSDPADYTWSLIQGPEGPQGDQGIQGVKGDTGAQGVKGDTGAQGPQGVQGPAGADGTPRYTWIKYADNATGTSGFSDSPTGKTYMGIAYNKLSSNESNTPGDYEWSLIKGADGADGAPGVPGPPGDDGQPTYTWIKYGTSSSGAGLSDSPNGKTYIGIAYNKTTQVESTNPGDYEWSLIQGPQGPQGQTGATGPQGPQGQTGATGDTGAQGPQGNTGATGRGISSTSISYAVNNSGTSAPAASAFTAGSVPATSPGQYLWTRTVLNYSTGSPSSTTHYSVAKHGDTGNTGAQGPQGDQGIKGDTGAQGPQGQPGATGTSITSVVPYYQLVADGAAAPAKPGNVANPGGSWTTTEPAYTPGQTLYRTERIAYSNNSYAYTDVALSSAYKAAKDAKIAADAATLANDYIRDPAFVTGLDNVRGMVELSTDDPEATNIPGPARTAGLLRGNDNWTADTSVRTIPGHTYRSEVDVRLSSQGKISADMESFRQMVWRFTSDGFSSTTFRYGEVNISVSPDEADGQFVRATMEWTAPADDSFGIIHPSLRGGANRQGADGVTRAPEWIVTNWHFYDITDIKAARDAADQAIKSYVTEYAVNSSLTVAPTSGWSQATPTRTPGQYIWTRTTVTYNNGGTSTTSPAVLTGNDGAKGDQGVKGDTGNTGPQGPQGTKGDTGNTGATGPQGPQGNTGATGAQGVSINSITPYYARVSESAAAPAKPGNVATPPSPWQSTEPTYTAGTSIYRTERVHFSNNVYSYTNVSKVSSYEAGKIAIASADGKTTTYYVDNTLPSGTGHKVGDTTYVINDGYKMYRWGGTALGWVPSLLGHQSIATMDAGKLTVGKINVAKLIDAASIFSQHLTVGSRGTSILTNGSMEDPGIDAGGNIRWDLFGGWKSSWTLGAGMVTSEYKANPISGSRSMRLTAASQNDGMRYVQAAIQPVKAGQKWVYRGTFRFSRAIDKSTIQDGDIVSLVAMTSNGAENPENFPSANVAWTAVDSRETVAGNTEITLEGTFIVPTGHVQMIAGFYAEKAASGGGYHVDCDEFYVYPAVEEITVVGPDGNVTASINDNGDAAFRDIDVTGDLRVDPERVIINGQRMTDRDDEKARGIIAYAERDPSVTNLTSEYGVMEFSWQTPPDADKRQYKISTRAEIAPSISHSSLTGIVKMSTRITTANLGSTPGTPSISSTLFTKADISVVRQTEIDITDFAIKNGLIPNLEVRTLVTLNAALGTDSLQTKGPVIAIIEDIGPIRGNNAKKNTGGGTLGSGGSDTGSSGSSGTTTRTKTFDCTWSRTFNGSGGQIDAGENATQGYFSGTNGNQKAAIGFDDASIRNTLSGATVDKVELYLYFSHWYYNSGGTAIIGRHGSTAAQSSWNSIGNKFTDVIRKGNWPKPGGQWVDITSMYANGWKNGDVTGVLLGPGPSTSKEYYGTAHGANQNNHPKVRFTYTK